MSDEDTNVLNSRAEEHVEGCEYTIFCPTKAQLCDSWCMNIVTKFQ